MTGALTPYIAKFPVFKHQEVFPLRNLPQPLHRFVSKIVDYVGMCFE